jgi:rod shape-determining protein MreC
MLKKRALTLFAVYMSAAIILMTYQRLNGPFIPLFYLKYPIVYANDAMTLMANAVKKPIFMLFAMKKENARLTSEVERLTLMKERYEEAITENERLQQLLGVREAQPGYVATARIISTKPDKWSQMMVVNAGSADGVGKDMAVRTTAGLIGKVLHAGRNAATVLLLTDINSSVAVRLQNSRLEGILSGTDSDVCILKYISSDVEVAVGDVVITSGLDELFPSEIPVGVVALVKRDPTSLFQIVQVKLYADPHASDEVMIVQRREASHEGI